MSDFPIIQIKNLPYKTSNLELSNLCARFGSLSQIRVPKDEPDGTAIAVFMNVTSAQKAAKELNGVNFQGRYLVAGMYKVDKSRLAAEDFLVRQEQVELLKQHYDS